MRERLSEVDRRLERLPRQHEMRILNNTQLLERASEVDHDGKEMRVRVSELEDILSASGRWGPETTDGLVKDFQDAFHLPEGTPEARLISTATAIAARWVDGLGMLGTIPCEDTWQRLAEKLNLRMLVYPPDQSEVGGQPVKATLRITGEFIPATASHVGGTGVKAATVSTPSLQHEPQRRF